MKKLFLTLCLLSSSMSFAKTDWIAEATKMNYDFVQQADASAKEILIKRATRAADQSASYDFTVKKGKYYTLFGDCSFECNDLDLHVFSGTISKEQDTDTDSSPIISFEAQENAVYTAQVDMVECEKAKCDYQIQIFESNKIIFE